MKMELFDLVPDTEIRTWVGPFQDRRLYFEAGKHEAQRFIELSEMRSSHHVLDMGCGCGKVAIHFMDYLTTGKYTGVDNCPELLQWCVDKIASLRSNFIFQFIDVYSADSHPAGKIMPSEMKLDIPDDSVDIVIANSLFTHMRIENVEPYLKEIYRVMKNGGKLLATYLLLNDETLRSISKGISLFDTKYNVGKFSKTKNEENPEEGIAHDEEKVMALYGTHGYTVTRIIHGGWGRNIEEDCQDLIIAIK